MIREGLLAQQENAIHAVTGEASATGIDPARVDLVSELARAKRISKIQSVLPRTSRALGEHFLPEAEAFMAACPPTSFRSRADGLKFYAFLRRCRPASPILDIAYCELAISALDERSHDAQPRTFVDVGAGRFAVRRAPGVRLRRCRFDVRIIFEADAAEIPAMRLETPTCLAILADRVTETSRIVHLSESLFDLLHELRIWKVLPATTDTATKHFFESLEQGGLIELESKSS